MVRDAADHRVLHDDAPLADRHRPALGREDGAEEDAALGADGHVAADGRVGCDVRRGVDAGPFAAMLEDHRRSPSIQIPATKRPGAKSPPGSNAALMPRMRATPSPGSPHTSTCAFTSGVARSTTSAPPRDSRPGRSAATSPATALASGTATRTTPLAACARQRSAAPDRLARAMNSPTSVGSM